MDYSDPLGALTTTRSAMTSGRSAYDQALASQLGALEQPVDRRGALMRMAQGFLSPTKTGAFAENVGMAMGNYADANEKMREQEMDRAMKLAQIQAARAKLQMEGAGQDFDLFSKGHGMMQDQNERQALDAFYGAGPALSGVAADASAGAGFDMPSLPGLDASGFAPGFNNAPVDAPVRRVTPQRPMPDEAAGDQRQMEEMLRLQSEAGADLPARNPTSPELLQPMPAPPGSSMDRSAIDPDVMASFASGPTSEPSLLSPHMAITPDQMHAFQRPQPQQAAPQQEPQQQQSRQDRTILGMPRPEGPMAQRAWDTLSLLESNDPRAQALTREQRDGIRTQAVGILKDTPEYKRAEAMAKDVSASPLGKLVREFESLPPDSPMRPIFEQAIAKEAAGSGMSLSVGPDGSIQFTQGNNAGQSDLPKPGFGWQRVENPDGTTRLVPEPGGPVEMERIAEERRTAARQASQQRAGQTVLRSVTRGLEDFLPNVVKGEGPVGANARLALSNVPGTAEYNLLGQIEDFRSNIGLDRLQQMREESPTGGALGQVPFAQQQRLERVLGDFDISQPLSTLEENLRELNNIYLDIMFGGAKERASLISEGKMTQAEADGIQQNYYETTFNEFGRRKEGGGKPKPQAPRVLSVEPIQ